MGIRKTIAVAFIAILIITWLVVFVTQVEAQTTDEQKQVLIGEWRGVSAGIARVPSTLIIHEIDTANAKARCTFTSASLGEKKYPVLADFIPGPNPKLEFKLEGIEYKFVLKKNLLQGTFKGFSPAWGRTVHNAIEMEKYPKK
jgi:hypothetical protein